MAADAGGCRTSGPVRSSSPPCAPPAWTGPVTGTRVSSRVFAAVSTHMHRRLSLLRLSRHLSAVTPSKQLQQQLHALAGHALETSLLLRRRLCMCMAPAPWTICRHGRPIRSALTRRKKHPCPSRWDRIQARLGAMHSRYLMENDTTPGTPFDQNPGPTEAARSTTTQTSMRCWSSISARSSCPTACEQRHIRDDPLIPRPVSRASWRPASTPCRTTSLYMLLYTRDMYNTLAGHGGLDSHAGMRGAAQCLAQRSMQHDVMAHIASDTDLAALWLSRRCYLG